MWNHFNENLNLCKNPSTLKTSKTCSRIRGTSVRNFSRTSGNSFSKTTRSAIKTFWICGTSSTTMRITSRIIRIYLRTPNLLRTSKTSSGIPGGLLQLVQDQWNHPLQYHYNYHKDLSQGPLECPLKGPLESKTSPRRTT